MELIIDTVKNLAVFLIFATVIKNLIGDSSYAKYTEFFIGLMMILILVGPLGKLFKMEGNLENFIQFNQINFDMKEAKNELFEGENTVDKAVLDQAEVKLEEQIETLAEKEAIYVNQCSIELSDEEETYGQICKIELWLSYEKSIRLKKISSPKQGDDKEKFAGFANTLKDLYRIDDDILFIYES